MLDLAPLPIPEPALAQYPVEVLLRHFTTALSSWLSDAHGLVQTGVHKDSKSKYPQLYLQDGQRYSKALYPDEQMRALCFFEYDGAASMKWDDPIAQTGYWLFPLAAVVWVHLPAIDPNRGYDFSPELALDFLTRGLLASPVGSDITPGSIEQRAERVFSRYPGWPEKEQLLMYPFSGFRIPFTVRSKYVACAQPFLPAPPPTPSTAPTLVVAAGNIPIGSLVAYNQQGATVLYDATLEPEAQTLYGISTTSGTAGQQVQVRTSGLIHIDGWGLQAGVTYLAGPAGKLVTSNQGLYFSQVIGRAVTADDFQLDPLDAVILSQP